LAARFVRDEEAVGSNPATPTSHVPSPGRHPAGRPPFSVRLRSDGVEIRAFQELMDDLYGEADRERGVPATVAWLCEELGELAQAVRKGSVDDQLHELGDVLAWLASLANQLGLSLDEAANRYVVDPPRA
jgi:NTP pyrophosphatase (non-canonical NTP hydrolase)